MERATVRAATGALDPVLAKLVAFLADVRTLPGGIESSDVILIKSELERIRSLLLRLWGRGDLDAACKDWMTEARELSYDMEDAIDDLLQKRTSEIPFEELKMRVKDVAEWSCEEWKTAPGTISNSSKPVVVDPSRFLHRDASALVGMEELRDELVELVVQGVDRRGDSSRRRIRTPCPAHKKGNMQKVVIKVEMHSDESRSKVLGMVASIGGVISVSITGDERDRVEVVGVDIEPNKLVSAIRRMFGRANILSGGPVKKPATVCEHPAAAHSNQRSVEIKTVCILGFAGGGKTALAELVYQAAGEQFDFRVFVSVSPSHSITEILRAILTQVTNAPYAGTEAVVDRYLIQEISNFLTDKRYLIIIDGIWYWEEWEIIRKSLPENNPGSRIIITTRMNAIAEKCLTDDNDAFVYEIGDLGPAGAFRLMQSDPRYVARSNGVYQRCIYKICSGVPLAIICMSSACAEQIQGVDGEFETMRVLRRIEDGILNIASLKPLAESLCLGYNDLPLHLKFYLLYCSIYSRHHKFEKDRLVMRWIAERFVYEEEVAEGYFDDLVDREWIKPVASESGKYEIHPMMLAFLRCKSQEDNLVTRLDVYSDISSSKQNRRLSLQVEDGHSVDISRMDLSHTRSLILFGSASAVPFKQFERLRVLELEDVKDLENAHLVDICGLFWLRHLGLKGVPITELPPEIGRLVLLETLDIRDTGVTELPWEAGKLPKSVRVLSGDNDSHQVIELPEGVYQDLENDIPPSSRGKCREVLSILLFDRFGVGTVPPEVGVFKVPGRRMSIPQLIKDHFKVLSSLDIRLFTLGEDDLKFLQEMPNLKTLVVRFEVVEPVTIGGAGFTMLESFSVDSRVPRVTFVPGAMPKLKRLAFKFYAGPASEDPVGITHLRSLEVVVFRCSPWYKSNSPGISATISVVRREAREHPNRITLFINDTEETLPEEQSAHVCRGDAGRREAGEYSNRITLNINDKEEILPDKQSALVCHGDASSSWTSGIAAEEADILCAHRNSLDAIASCSRPSEIEEVYAQL